MIRKGGEKAAVQYSKYIYIYNTVCLTEHVLWFGVDSDCNMNYITHGCSSLHRKKKVAQDIRLLWSLAEGLKFEGLVHYMSIFCLF